MVFQEEKKLKWNKYRMKTTTQAVDMISYTLGEMGIEGIEIGIRRIRPVLAAEQDMKRYAAVVPGIFF